MKRCIVCRQWIVGRGLLCGPCQRSYDRMLATKSATILEVIRWAANRSRRFEREWPGR